MCHWGFGPFLSAHTTLCLFLHLADSPSSSQSYFSFRYALQGTVNSFLKMLCHQLQLFCLLLSLPCLSWWHSCHLLSHTGHPCLHLHHHCHFQVVSVISSPPWLPSPGSRLHFPVQSLLVAWWVLDTLTVAIYERKVIPCSKSLYVGWLGGFRLCHVVADFLLKQCLIPFWMHEPGHFSNTSEHVDTINFPEPTTRQTDKLSVQSKKYRPWADWRRLGTHGWNR